MFEKKTHFKVRENTNGLSNNLRTFLFKLHNNILSYNHVLTHFAEGVEPYCTFCIITGENVLERDNAHHVFFSCPSVEVLNEAFFSWIFGNNRIVTRREIFGNFQEENSHNNGVLFIITKNLTKFHLG